MSDRVWNVLSNDVTVPVNPVRAIYVSKLKQLITQLSHKCYLLYGQKRYYARVQKTFRKHLIKYGLLYHGNFNTSASNVRTLRRRMQSIKLCVQYQNSLVLDAINLREHYLMHDIKHNASSYEVLLPKFELLFVRQQHQLGRILSQDAEYGCALTMAGILNNWSEKKWEKFNLYVCFIH